MPITFGISAPLCSTWNLPTRTLPAVWWTSCPAQPMPRKGKIKKVAVATYIITPYNVDIIGDLIDELENNGMYF